MKQTIKIKAERRSVRKKRRKFPISRKSVFLISRLRAKS